MKKIIIPLSQSDLEELLDGKKFEWVFPTEGKAPIDIAVHLYNEDA